MAKNITTSGKLKARDLERAIYQEFKANARKQLNPKQLQRKLKVKNSKDSVQAALDKLVSTGKVKVNGDFRYQYAGSQRNGSDGGGGGSKGGKRSNDYAEGRVDMTRSGAAYVIMDGEANDIYVPAQRMNNAQDGDKVKVRFWTPGGRRKPEGEVAEVLEHSVTHFVGSLKIHDKYAEVNVDGPGGKTLSVAVHRAELIGAKDGEKVVVEITDWEVNRYGQISGKITAVLGTPGSSDIEMQSILINNGFQITFPEDVLAESEALPGEITPQEINIRRDMREVTTFTIDPLTAKDFDDALSIQYLDDGQIEIGVHIADVSHYVKPGSALDAEAADRTTSVYLVDRVCPMLPERISNELCSLRPHEDKLTFSAVFKFHPKTFKVTDRWFGRTVIHSDRRFTYEDAQEVLNTGEGDFVDELDIMDRIADKLRKRRFKEGSIDFNSNEVRFKLDDDGKPLSVYVKERIDTNMLIEDFMLLANREVAGFIKKKQERLKTIIPFVYRVHDEPDMEKVAELAKFAAALGYEMDLSSPQTVSKSYNALLAKAEEDPMVKMLSPIAIRTMSKAVYTTENIGHYGLGFENYSHFTSPIRRYADVLVHRLLAQNLEKGSLFKANAEKLEETCKHISSQERKAVTAERESIKYKQTEFMLDNIGEEFTGVINGLADFGVFIELTESFVEGMISFDKMDEPYDLSAGKLSIVGKKSGKKLKMGDLVRVKIEDVNLERRRIDMSLVEVLKIHGEEKVEKKTRSRRGRS
ncbi:Ribonuclease R [Neolewinella maritima]|uniref:Ribonuclease R n=1 Tax=Neolewinella maritima TaxID=1383882 RepID=A0ABN8F6Z8_9BACT|nr:ribonuclease R [Neolewinella maritima]CAH1002342.1 Ribonuclease R [Neolewinella maritima]